MYYMSYIKYCKYNNYSLNPHLEYNKKIKKYINYIKTMIFLSTINRQNLRFAELYL